MSELFKNVTLDSKPGKAIARGSKNGVSHEIFADDKNIYVRVEGKQYASAAIKSVAAEISKGELKTVNQANNKPRKAGEYTDADANDLGSGLFLNGNASGFISGKFVCEPDDLVAEAL